ncbi:MAG: cupin domain-containing protein, partial [Candidatus Limnocylindria bacterium]
MSEIRLVRADERTSETQQTAGMVREAAIAEEGRWAGVVRAGAGSASGWHHHGEHDTVIYVLAGTIGLEYGRRGERAITANAGDFVHLPPRTVHREANATSEAAALVVVRHGRGAP